MLASGLLCPLRCNRSNSIFVGKLPMNVVFFADTDLRQLLNERISIWAPRAELMRQFNFFDGRKFEERVGYPPEKFVLLRKCPSAALIVETPRPR